MIYNILFSPFERTNIIEFLRAKKIENPNYKVIDIYGLKLLQCIVGR